MNRLLSSGFCRMFKSKLFWILNALCAAYGILMRVTIIHDEKYSGSKLPLDITFFTIAVFIGIAIAVFASIFIGTDYSDGTIRNKIAAGHKKSVIYLSNLIIISVSGIIFLAFYCLTSFLSGVIMHRWFSGEVLSLLGTGFTCIMMIIAYSSIFVFTAMLCQNRSSSAVICLLTAFSLLFASMIIAQKLNAPEFYDNYVFDPNGEIVGKGEPIPNPSYPRGLERELLLLASDALPSGQGLQISQMYSLETTEFDYALPLYSLAIIVLFTGSGILTFRKKDLK